ncbi:hypothetical protein QWZ13_15705 [Reinekea marina]|uniref:hypothetical protein n=1 Tax=Reinekea marina TaxID=1310421 RepID=UPI0025B59C88|nr:hypothetical protein [Reinekea marina]MDN3650352.1 hypothetical protein [Reinekea marina]
MRFVGGELLIDKSGQGENFLKEVTDFYSAGPEPLKPDARKHLVEWSLNMVQRASGQSFEASYRRTLLLCQLLEVYFELRDHWFLGSKLSFSWLKEKDCEAYNLFETAFNEPTNLEALKKLVIVTINTDRSD